MTIIDKTIPNAKEFYRIDTSQIFRYRGDVFLKMSDIDTEKGRVNAVSLNDGIPTFFTREEKVESLEGSYLTLQ